MGVSPDMEITLPVPQVLSSDAPPLDADWEKAVVRGSQQGDPEAFRLLMERYQGKVFSIAYSMIRRRQDVEDIAQQVFTKVYFRISQFDFRSAFLTWIYKITINECMTYFANNGRTGRITFWKLTRTFLLNKISRPRDA